MAPKPPPRIIFLTATFPSVSETFVLRELRYLVQSESIRAESFAIRRPSAGMHNPEYPDLESRTSYLRPDHLFAVLASPLMLLPVRPLRLFRTLRRLLRALTHAPFAQWPRLIFHFHAGAYIARTAQREQFDAVHAHFDAATNIALFSRLLGGPPFTAALHASDDIYYGRKPLLRDKIAAASHIITENQYNVRHINLLTNWAHETRIECVYNAIDATRLEPIPPKPRVDSPLRLLSVGNFTGFKGYVTTLDALAELKQRGLQFSYHIVGDGDPAEKHSIEQRIQRHALQQQVTLLGRRTFKEVWDEMRWCDILVMNSEINEAGKRDGMPTVISEAMLANRLVVSTYISDIPSVITSGETGFLVGEQQPMQLADAIERGASDADNYVAIVKRAHDKARSTFSSSVNHERVASIISGVAST